jgi:hypothetical protein
MGATESIANDARIDGLTCSDRLTMSLIPTTSGMTDASSGDGLS